MPTNGRHKLHIRMDDGPKAEFVAATYNLGTTATDVVKQLISWWMREPGAELPQRPEEPAMATTTEYGSWGNHNHWGEVEASVTEFLGEFIADFDVAALTSAYQDAITDALPDGWVLRGDDFYGPYPHPDGYTEVIAEAIESVDLGELAEKFDRSIEGGGPRG